MAFAEVATSRAMAAGVTDGAQLAYPANRVAGELLTCAGAFWNAGGAPASLTVVDTLGTSYDIKVSGVMATNVRTWIAQGIAPSSGANTVTVDPAGVDSVLSFSITAHTGNTPVASVDGGSTAATSTTPSDSITTATADELIIGVMTQDGSTTALTPAGTQTQFGEDETNTADQCHNACFRIATTAGSYTMSWTMTPNVDNMAQTISIKETAGAAGKYVNATIVNQAVNRASRF